MDTKAAWAAIRMNKVHLILFLSMKKKKDNNISYTSYQIQVHQKEERKKVKKRKGKQNHFYKRHQILAF